MDKQRFKLGGVDMSSSYLLFLTLFLLFWTLICMIWMKLTRTDVVFSRTTMVLFLCRNISSRVGTKLCEEFYIIKENFRAKNNWRGAPGWAKLTRARPPPGAPRWVFPTRWPRMPQPWYYKITYLEQKIKEKELFWFTRGSRRYLLFFIGRPDLESVWGSREGDLRSSSSPTLVHRQFHDAPHREWVIPS